MHRTRRFVLDHTVYGAADILTTITLKCLPERMLLKGKQIHVS